MGVHAVSLNHPFSPEIFGQTTSNLTQFPYIKPAWLIWKHFFKCRKNGCANWFEKIPKFTRFSPAEKGQKQGWKTGVCIAWILTRSHPFFEEVRRAEKMGRSMRAEAHPKWANRKFTKPASNLRPNPTAIPPSNPTRSIGCGTRFNPILKMTSTFKLWNFRCRNGI